MEQVRKKPGNWLHAIAIEVQQLVREVNAGSRFVEMVSQWQTEDRERHLQVENWEAKRIEFVRKNGHLYPQELDACGKQPDPAHEFAIETLRLPIAVPPQIAREYIAGERRAEYPKWIRRVLNDPKHVDPDRPLPPGWQRVQSVVDLGAWVPPELAWETRPKVEGPPPLHLGPKLTLAASYAALAAVHDACIDAISEHFGEDVPPIIRTDNSEWLDWQPYVLMQLLRIPELKQKHRKLLDDMLRVVGADLNRPKSKPNGNESEDPWPPDHGWHFRLGEAAFNGTRIPVTGRHWVLLRCFATARHAVTCDSLRDALAPVAEVELADDTLRAYVSQLRRLLRSTFNLPERVDPLPAVRSGTVRGWKLADELLR